VKKTLDRIGKYTMKKKKKRNKESTPLSETNPAATVNDETGLRLPDPPAGMMRVMRTELVWPGKYNEDGTLKEVPRVNLPFQVIETINESRATRQALTQKGGIQRSLFDIYEGNEGDTFEDGWKNKLIWGDNLLVMGSLLEKFAGKIDLIYIDPPFATGTDFSFKTHIGEADVSLTKKQSSIEEKAYRDTWGHGMHSYLLILSDRLRLIHSLLADGASFFLHVDWHVAGPLRVLCDEIFGGEALRNEIIWCYHRFGIGNQKQFTRAHDNIFWYSKGSKRKFNLDSVRIPYSEKTKANFVPGAGGSGFGAGELNEKGKIPEDYMIIAPAYKSLNEVLPFPTQKPEALLRQLILATTDKNDLVADFFCGSGTALAVGEKLGRRWIGCDLGRWGIHVTRKRLLGIESCKPFEVLNLGKYERQYWQGVTFGEAKNKHLTEQALYEYLAFILKLYGAQPVSGLIHLHGKKNRAMVHIGAVDAPVTISEIDAAVDECVQVKQPELHVVGWEWEMGLYDLMVDAAKKKGVKLLLLQIPREVMEQQAAAKGDVRFFELAYLEAEIKTPKKLTAQVSLKDFVIPNTELIPEEVRSKVKKWSDYIDYWAVDWDFQNDTFMQGWVAFRTRKERKLTLTSEPHRYKKAGTYRILVKVIDIFGNDTSQAFDVEVS
jgi:adenine-specific DNA-methyltransferase